VVQELVDEAAVWLRGKKTDQWAKPWPDRDGRDRRILGDLARDRTWVVWDDNIAAGTITIDTEDPVDAAENLVWPAHRLTESALYVHRVIVRRSHAGLELGARLFDWASARATRLIGSPLLRIDVWTDNWDLHAYYRRQGFTLCEFRDPRELPDYPARALFERRVSPNGRHRTPLFREQHPAEPGSTYQC
jgi:GNAT superfamily N-acetyltransferase